MMVNYRVLLVFFYQFWAVFATGPDLLSLDFLSTKYFGIVGAVVFGQPAPEPRCYAFIGFFFQRNVLELLVQSFSANPHPSRAVMEHLALVLNTTFPRVRNWFVNRFVRRPPRSGFVGLG